MKKACLFVAVLFLLTACSKKNGPDPNNVAIGGITYPTVTIGNQVWTTVNYNGTGGYHADAQSQYGSYYTQSQALAITLPSGWRVPTMNDYSILLSNFSSQKDDAGYYEIGDDAAFLSTSGWSGVQGTNRTGFNALPGGLFQVSGQNPVYFSTGMDAYFVTADVNNQYSRYGFWISSTGIRLYASAATEADYESYSLRFVKDK
jgi:uncharacterized protein (TIGR02145 family)